MVLPNQQAHLLTRKVVVAEVPAATWVLQVDQVATGVLQVEATVVIHQEAVISKTMFCLDKSMPSRLGRLFISAIINQYPLLMLIFV